MRQRYRDADSVANVVAEVGLVERSLHLYAGLVGEKNATESIVVAAGLRISAAEAGRLVGTDFVELLNSSRTEVDNALAASADSGFAVRADQLLALRVLVDAGHASDTAVRSYFDGTIRYAESAWRAQLSRLADTSLNIVGSTDIKRAITGLGDTVDAFIAGASANSAAGALSVAGVSGAATGATDLAGAMAVYTRATVGMSADLVGTAAEAWKRLIVDDPDVNAFRQFLAKLLRQPFGKPGGVTIPELAKTFKGGLIYQDHLRRVVAAAAADVLPLARHLRTGAEENLVRYVIMLGVIAVLSFVIALMTARQIVSPLRRLAARASEVSAGEIAGTPLNTSGLYEVASVTGTFNEIVANLTAVDAATMALAAADLDSPVLTISVPGRIGDSLRHSVDTLQQSIRDNDELRRSLERSEARFRELADGSPDIVLRISRDPTPHFDYVSPSARILTGISASAVRANFQVFVDALDPATQGLLADAIAGRPLPDRFDTTIRRPDGTLVIFEVHVAETPDGLQGTGRDVTEIRSLQAQLAEQATQDPLTGLANRRLLDELLGRALRRANRSGEPLTVAFLDLDDFKSVNDTYGHDAGDAVLRATAARLQVAVRDADVVARYGGDEFVIVYEGAPDDAVPTLADRIDAALRPPIDIGNDITVSCTPSIGIADTRTTATDPTALINAADLAMLHVKRLRARSRTPEMRRVFESRLT
ncbi:MAG TPA: diguanylate cyclase [Acidimicrobiia bacterium]|nr:diguanylate cyclase [Acidimicrobiia bacterium]